MKFKALMIALRNISYLFAGMVLLASCNHNFDSIPVHEHPRWEFAPNMYHSEAYEPVTMVDDSNKYPLSYNVMPFNNNSNLRMPVPGTIKRGFMPYHIAKDSLELASRILVSPYAMSDTTAIVKGEVLYMKYCQHCHGEQGKGDGPVSTKYKGVANLTGAAMKAATEGHIFHVITMGKGKMASHASQVDANDRWYIARYIKAKLQAQ
jgi:hypothetical protein